MILSKSVYVWSLHVTVIRISEGWYNVTVLFVSFTVCFTSILRLLSMQKCVDNQHAICTDHKQFPLAALQVVVDVDERVITAIVWLVCHQPDVDHVAWESPTAKLHLAMLCVKREVDDVQLARASEHGLWHPEYPAGTLNHCVSTAVLFQPVVGTTCHNYCY